MIKEDPNNAKILFRRSQCYFHTNELEKAKTDCVAAIKILPNDKSLRNFLDQIFQKSKELSNNSKKFFGSIFKNTEGILYKETKTPYFWEGKKKKKFFTFFLNLFFTLFF